MRWFAVPNLMMLLSGLMLAVFLLEIALPEEAVSQYLWLDWNAVRAGQIWRVLSFLILPPAASPFFLLFSLYFFCLMGNGLESQWGTSKFTLFYTVGALGTIIGSLFTGFATNQYLNLSLFLAFAAIYPNYTVMVFFILPVKVKYLALLDVKDFDSLDEAEKGVIAELACYMLNVNGSIMADTLITGDDELGYSNNASQWNDGTPEENMAKYFRLLLKKNALQAWQCQDFLHRGNLTAENMANFYRYRRV